MKSGRRKTLGAPVQPSAIAVPTAAGTDDGARDGNENAAQQTTGEPAVESGVSTVSKANTNERSNVNAKTMLSVTQKAATSFSTVSIPSAANVRTTSSFVSNGSSLLASLESSHNAAADNDDNGFNPLKLLAQKPQQGPAKPVNTLDISSDAISNIFMQDSNSNSDNLDISTFMKFDDPNNPLLQAAKEPLSFDYCDSDSLLKELGDLYSYTELGDFARNRLAFQQVFRRFQPTIGSGSAATLWTHLIRSEQDALVTTLLAEQQNLFASENPRAIRMQLLRALLYLAQGSYPTDRAKMKDSIIEKHIRSNICCLFRNGVWPSLLVALKYEAENTSTADATLSTFSLKDSSDLRIILNLIYTVVEVLRRPVVAAVQEPVQVATATGVGNATLNATTDAGNTSLSSSGAVLPTFDVPSAVGDVAVAVSAVDIDNADESGEDSEEAVNDEDEDEFNTFREQMVENLRIKCIPQSDNTRDTLIVYLVKMLRQYIDGNHSHYPVKKIVLLLWKCLLTSLGGFSDLRRLKEEKRMEKGLPPGLEDTLEVARRMISSSPPMTGVEMLAAEIGRRSTIPSGNLFSLTGSGGGLQNNNSNNSNSADGRKAQPQRRLTGMHDVFSGVVENSDPSKPPNASYANTAGGPSAAKRRAMLRRTSEAPRASSTDDVDNNVDSNASNANDGEKANDAGDEEGENDSRRVTLTDADIRARRDAFLETDKDAQSVEKTGIDESSSNTDEAIDEEEAARLLAQQQLVKNKRKRSFEEEVANEFNEKMPPSAEDEEADDDVIEQEEDDNETSGLSERNKDDSMTEDDLNKFSSNGQKKARKNSKDEEDSMENFLFSAVENKSPLTIENDNKAPNAADSNDPASNDDDECSSQISSLASSVFSIRELADEKKLIERPLREVSHLKRLSFTPKVRQQDVYRWLSRVRAKLSQQQNQQQPQPPSPASSAGANGAAQTNTAGNGSLAQNGAPTMFIPRPIAFFSPPFPPYSRMAQHINMNFSQWNDHLTAGLPYPALNSYKILQRYLYYSLSEVYLQEEQDMTAYPYAVGMQLYPRPTGSFTEQLYVELLEEMPTFVVSLIRCIIAAGPSHKSQQQNQQAGGNQGQRQQQQNAANQQQSAVAGGEQVSVVNDMMPSDISPDIVEKLGIDVSRHKEIIMKACTFILLLLMKHLKVNNTFQFEYLSILMVQGNGIALMMRFLNQNLLEYVEQINCVPQLEYPACVFGPSRRKSTLIVGDPLTDALREYPVEPLPAVAGENYDDMSLNPENFSMQSNSELPRFPATNLSTSGCQSVLDLPSSRRFSARNLYTTVNMLRIMQKLTKWKYARTLCLLHFKSQAKLKPLLRIRCPLLQVYVLKLLKCQVRYLGRQWRKSNMKIVSAIYSKVRHRLSDEWAFGHLSMSEPELKLAIEDPKDEHALRGMVEGFNKRHYPHIMPRMPLVGPASGNAVAQQQSKPNNNTADANNFSDLAAVVSQQSVDLGANVWDMPPPWEINDKLASTIQHTLSEALLSSSSSSHLPNYYSDTANQQIDELNDGIVHTSDDMLVFGNNVAAAEGSNAIEGEFLANDDDLLAEQFRTSLDLWINEEVMKKSYMWDELIVKQEG